MGLATGASKICGGKKKSEMLEQLNNQDLVAYELTSSDPGHPAPAIG